MTILVRGVENDGNQVGEDGEQEGKERGENWLEEELR